MAKVKKLTALDIVPKTVRKRKRRSRRNIGRVGIQESFRQRQQVGLTRTQEQEEQILLRQQRDVRRTQILLLQRQQQRLEAKQKQKQKKPHHRYQQQRQQLQQQQRQYHLQMQQQQRQQQQQLQQQQQPSNHLLYNNNASNNHSTYDMQGNIRYHKLLKTSIENQQKIISLSNQIYNTNNDGYITFSDSVISSGKTPMYILPEFHPTPNVLIPADIDHFKIANKNNDNNSNILRSPMMRNSNNMNVRIGKEYQAELPPCKVSIDIVIVVVVVVKTAIMFPPAMTRPPPPPPLLLPPKITTICNYYGVQILHLTNK